MGKATAPKKARKTEAQRMADKAVEIGFQPHQVSKGGFALVDVKIDPGEKVTTTTTLRNRKAAAHVEWFLQGGPGFDAPQLRAVEYIQRLWAKAETAGRIVANYGFISRGGVEGRGHFEAIEELGEWRKEFGTYWDVFENVIRFGEPAGIAGSRLATNRPQATAAAKAIVGLVGSVIATRKRM